MESSALVCSSSEENLFIFGLELFMWTVSTQNSPFSSNLNAPKFIIRHLKFIFLWALTGRVTNGAIFLMYLIFGDMDEEA